MGKERGLNVLLKVGDGATSETFNTLAGQQNTVMEGSTNQADTTDKSNNGWQTGIATTRSGTVTSDGQVDWTDTAWGDIHEAWRTGADINCELVLNAAGDKYAGTFNVTNLQITGPVDGVTGFSLTLTPIIALTYTAGV